MSEVEKFKVEVRPIIERDDMTTELGRYAWLCGHGEDLAIGTIYVKEKDATAYNRDELSAIVAHAGLGHVFIVTRIIPA